MRQRIFRGFYVGNLRSEKSKTQLLHFTAKKTYRPIRRATVPLFIRKVPENDTEYLFQSGSIYYFFSIRKFVLLLDVGLSIGQNESRGLVITERVILKPDQRLKPFQKADFGPEEIRYGCWLWMGFVNDNAFFSVDTRSLLFVKLTYCTPSPKALPEAIYRLKFNNQL